MKGGYKMKLSVRKVILLVVCFAIIGSTASFAAAARGLDEKVNINSASADKLAGLPYVGEVLAKRIVDYRSKNGKFGKIEDLKNVKGIGVRVFEHLKERITVK